jgi:hypothetical protein
MIVYSVERDQVHINCRNILLQLITKTEKQLYILIIPSLLNIQDLYLFLVRGERGFGRRITS